MIQGSAGLRCLWHRPIRGPHATTRASNLGSCFPLILSDRSLIFPAIVLRYHCSIECLSTGQSYIVTQAIPSESLGRATPIKSTFLLFTTSRPPTRLAERNTANNAQLHCPCLAELSRSMCLITACTSLENFVVMGPYQHVGHGYSRRSTVRLGYSRLLRHPGPLQLDQRSWIIEALEKICCSHGIMWVLSRFMMLVFDVF